MLLALALYVAQLLTGKVVRGGYAAPSAIICGSLGAFGSGQCKCIQVGNPVGCAFDVPWSGVVSVSSGPLIQGSLTIIDSVTCVSYTQSSASTGAPASTTTCPVLSIDNTTGILTGSGGPLTVVIQ
jgi:hypothetical protein